MKNHCSYFMKFLLYAFVLTLLISSTTVLAAKIRVPQDYQLIQTAIDAAYEGDTVLVADGTYKGTGNKNLDFRGKAITVMSEGGPENCIIDCEGDGRGFKFDSQEGSDSVISGFTINNGDEGGIYCDSTSPTITNCIISGNTNEFSFLGSGIECDNNSSPNINNTTISGNNGTGIGLLFNLSSPTINKCIINENTSAGIRIGTVSSPTITDCTISGNMLGGIKSESHKSPIIENCTITDNKTLSSGIGSKGGGIYVGNSSHTIRNCIISGNTAEYGGGISFTGYYSTSTLTNCIIANNTANYGGGIYCDEEVSSPTIMNATITNNTSNISGGGIFSNSRNLKITNSILWTNSPNELAPFSPDYAVDYSDIEGGHSGTGNTDADPEFVGNGDYHLTASSPCIDAGTSEGAPNDDIDGDLRPQGAGYDMGADEYAGIEPTPVADFSANPTSGPAPLMVIFTDQSTGDVTSWNWDFGDGATSTEQNPTHTYTDSGTYTVSLTVTGPLGTDTETKTDFIVARDASFSTAAAFAVLANMYSDSAMANAVNALDDPSYYYPLAALYASKAYEFAEDAYEDATAALAAAQSYTFWGYYAPVYAESDINVRDDAVDSIVLAAQYAAQGDIETAEYYLGYGLSLAATADLYNGSTIWCASMEASGQAAAQQSSDASEQETLAKGSPSFSNAATNAVLSNMNFATSVAYGAYTLDDPSYIPLVQLYASTSYDYAEDAYIEAHNALSAAGQDFTFWGYYASNYAEHDFTNKADALDYFNQAVAAYQGGNLETLWGHLTSGLLSASLADLYNGAVIWCASMESEGATK